MSSTSGKWWIHGEDKMPFAGKLECDAGSLEMEITVPRGITDVDNAYAHRPLKMLVPSTIYGKDGDDKWVTLFGCSCRGHQSSAGEEVYEIRALAGIRGAKVEDWKQPVARCVRLKLEKFHRWLGQDALLRFSDKEAQSWSVPRYQELIFPVSADLQLRINRFTRHNDSFDGEHFLPETEVWLVFRDAKSADEVSSRWVTWTTRFFSLLVGTSIRCEEIALFPDDLFEETISSEDYISRKQKECTILGRSSILHRVRLSDPNSYVMHAPFKLVENELEGMLKRWLEVTDRLEPVVDLFSTVVFHQNLHYEAEFLFLVQALEVYHVRSGHFAPEQLDSVEHKRRKKLAVDAAPDEIKGWVKQKVSSNYKHLGERLTEIFYRNLAEATALFCPIVLTADRVKYTRNQLTHYNQRTDIPRYLKPMDIAQVNVAMEHFIWVLLLREIGAPAACIPRTMRTAPTAHFVGLS